MIKIERLSGPKTLKIEICPVDKHIMKHPPDDYGRAMAAPTPKGLKRKLNLHLLLLILVSTGATAALSVGLLFYHLYETNRVVQGLHELLAPVHQIALGGLLMVLGILLIFLLIGRRCAEAILHPIGELAKAADDMTRGDMGVILPASAQDEIGALARSLRTMQVQHQARMDELLRSEERYRTLVENSLTGILILTADEVRFANRTMEEVTGYTLEDLRDIAPWDIVHPEERGKVRHMYLDLLRGKPVPVTYETRWVHKDGRTIWVEVRATRMEEQEEPAILVNVVNMTDRKQVEEVLRQERERLSTVLDGSPVPTFMIDRNHRVVLWNRASESLTSIPRDRVLGKPLDLSPLYPEDTPPILAELILKGTDEEILRKPCPKGIRKDETYREAFQATSRIWVNGQERILTLLATRLRDPGGEVVGAIQCAQDMTEREHLQRQLQHAQKMEAVGTLAGGMAHEFNNILAAIQGYAQLLLLVTEPDPPMAGYLREIDASCLRAAGLTHKMLTFARLDEGEKLPVKVNRVVEEVQGLLRQTLSPRIELEVTLQEGLPFVMAEASQLEQVLLNLGVNARDAMPHGGKIRFGTRQIALDETFCRTHPWARPGQYVEIFVEDDGEGMHSGVLEHIFEPFFTTKEPGKGTGLGLSIAYSIVKNHGGYILAESQEDQGTCFRLFLPAMEEIRERRDDLDLDEALPRGRGERVLVVEDETHLQDIAREMLERNGYRVTIANDGEEALDLYREGMARQQLFHLVILDLGMPVMDGETCLKRLLDMNPQARVLIVTGYGGDEPRHSEIFPSTVKGVIHKPFDLPHLLKETRRALEESSIPD